MPLTADRVVVELEAKLDRYEANVARAEAKFDRAMGNIQKSATRTEGVVSRAMKTLGTALSITAAVALGRALLDMADKAKTLEASLRLATKETGSFAVAQRDVSAIAKATRADLIETGRLYASFARAAGELGINQQQVAAITTTVSQAFTVSGTSAADAANATRQLSQAFASGVLRGDEFNSIMENAPRLAKLLADSLGVPVGALRKMAEEGELTADRLTRALSDRRFTEGLQAEFEQMPVTFDQAMTLVHNSAIETFAAFDRGGQFSTMIANFVSDGADGMSDFASSAEDAGARVRAEFEGVAAVFRNALDELGLFKAFLDNLGGGDAVNRAAQITRDILDPLGTIVRNSPAYQEAQQKALGEAALRKVMAGDPFADFPQLRGSGSAPRPRPVATAKPAGGRKRTGGAKKSPLDPEAFAREEAQLNAEILSLKADQVTDVAQQAELELQRLKLLQDREAAETRSNERMTASEQERAVALQGVAYALRGAAVVANRDKELLEQATEAQEKASAAQRENLRYELDALSAQADNARTRQDRLAVERSILDLLEKQEQAELDALILARKIADPVAAQNALRASQAGRRTALERDGQSPLERYRDQLNRSPDAINDEIEGFVVDELQRVQDSIASGLTKALGIDNPLINRLVSLFLEQQIIRPIMEGLAGGAGGGGIFGGLLGGIFGFASGGSMMLGGRGGTDRNVLALNGRPIANVSRGETLNVGSKALSPARGGTVVISAPQFHLRGAVITPQLYADMERISNASAAKAGAASYERSMRDAPAAVARKQRYGA